MIETDLLTMVSLANEAGRTLALVGPPGDLPAPVPDFVGGILDEIGSSMGDAAGGIGDAISGLTPGGESTSTADGASEAADATPGN